MDALASGAEGVVLRSAETRVTDAMIKAKLSMANLQV